MRTEYDIVPDSTSLSPYKRIERLNICTYLFQLNVPYANAAHILHSLYHTVNKYNDPHGRWPHSQSLQFRRNAPKCCFKNLPSRCSLLYWHCSYALNISALHALTGRSSTTRTHSGHANPGSRVRAKSFRTFSNPLLRPFHSFAASWCNTTNAMGRSPHLGCGRATTATSCTEGCSDSSRFRLEMHRV